MSLNLVPELRIDSFIDATPELLSSLGVKGLVLDVDNTLEPYENPLPGERVKAWLKQVNDAGISCAIVSNNGHERIDVFNSELGLPCYCKAKKPFSKSIRLAMKTLGTDTSNTILMGDQVFTDVWAAHNAGIRAILVPPIKDKRDFLTRFKRLLEKPILKRYMKIHSRDNVGK